MALPDMQNGGPLTVAKFWLQMLCFGLALSTGIFAIYWMAISASSIWLNAVGGAILATNVFLMLLSFASFVFLALSIAEFKILYDGFAYHLFAVCAFLAQVLCCVLLSLSTNSAAGSDLEAILNYCSVNANNPNVVNFLNSHVTNYSIYSYVAKRTTDSYASIAALFGIWLPATLILLFVSQKAEHEPKRPPKPKQPKAPEKPKKGEDDLQPLNDNKEQIADQSHSNAGDEETPTPSVLTNKRAHEESPFITQAQPESPPASPKSQRSSRRDQQRTNKQQQNPQSKQRTPTQPEQTSPQTSSNSEGQRKPPTVVQPERQRAPPKATPQRKPPEARRPPKPNQGPPPEPTPQEDYDPYNSSYSAPFDFKL